MKIAPILIVVIALTCVNYSNAAPQPIFKILNDLVGTATKILGGALEAITGAIKGILKGALGGILGGILSSGVGGKISVNPSEGGCQAVNVAKVISNLFSVLRIPVVTCRSDYDCRHIGPGICSSISAFKDGKICQVTRRQNFG